MIFFNRGVPDTTELSDVCAQSNPNTLTERIDDQLSHEIAWRGN